MPSSVPGSREEGGKGGREGRRFSGRRRRRRRKGFIQGGGRGFQS